MHGDLDDPRLRRPPGAAYAPDRGRETRPELALDARRALGALRPRAAHRPVTAGRSGSRPLPALEGARPNRVLRGARGEGLHPGGVARRLRLVRLGARVPPGPRARPRRRDFERLARTRAPDRCRQRARARCARSRRAARLLPRRRRRARGGEQLGSRAARRPPRARTADDRRGRQSLVDVRLARRSRAPLRARRLECRARRRPRPRCARGRTRRRRHAAALCRRGDRSMSMRKRFYSVAAHALDEDPRVALVLAEIGVSELPRHPRVFNVGIREQLMIGVAAGLALEGLRPVVHSYTPFLIERPYEQIKLDLGHQDVGAVLVSTGASYDAARSGRTHQAPEDVALLAALPGWTIHVPGHPDEAERLTRSVLFGDDRVYIRLSDEENAAPVDGDGLVVI